MCHLTWKQEENTNQDAASHTSMLRFLSSDDVLSRASSVFGQLKGLILEIIPDPFKLVFQLTLPFQPPPTMHSRSHLVSSSSFSSSELSTQNQHVAQPWRFAHTIVSQYKNWRALIPESGCRRTTILAACHTYKEHVTTTLSCQWLFLRRCSRSACLARRRFDLLSRYTCRFHPCFMLKSKEISYFPLLVHSRCWRLAEPPWWELDEVNTDEDLDDREICLKKTQVRYSFMTHWHVELEHAVLGTLKVELQILQLCRKYKGWHYIRFSRVQHSGPSGHNMQKPGQAEAVQWCGIHISEKAAPSVLY